MSLKSIAKVVVDALGYEVRKKSNGFHADPFHDQRKLMSGRDVRVVLDLGANVGQTAGAYLALFPEATVHSFEPFAEPFQALAALARANPRLRAHQLAVADVTGTKAFFTNNNHVTNSLLPPAAGAVAYVADDLLGQKGSTEVRAITLDDFCAREQIDAVPVLKLDIQGGELMALRGAESLLNRRAVDLIFTEVNFVPLYEGQAYFDDVYQFLKARDYSLYGLYGLAHGTNGMLAWGDAIFIGPDLRRSLDRR